MTDRCSDRCSACPGRFHVVHGDGPAQCRAAMYGQNPGKQEEANAARGLGGRVFIGDAGRELNEHYLAIAGLVRSEDVFISNVMKCHTENDRKPSPREIAACSAHWMPSELEEHAPEIVVLMGAPACSIVPEIWLEAHHGYPMRVNLFGKDRWVVPMYHPAAGLHNPAVMTPLIQDFERLRRILKGDYSVPEDAYPDPVYKDLTGDHEAIRYYSNKSNGSPFMARDTEFLQEKGSPVKAPFCVTFTLIPGTGYMIRADDREGLRILGESIKNFHTIFHNALADQDVEEAMGLPHIPVWEFDDTMQLAAHQQDLPQKLKALAWRLAGMTMQDYEDVVLPFSRDAVLEWLEQAYDIAVMTPGTKYVSKKRKIPKTDKAMNKLLAELDGHALEDHDDGYFHFKVPEQCDSELTKKILHIHKHTAKPVPPDADKPYSPWEAWREQVVENLGQETEYEITKRIGEMPKVSIAHVFNKAPQKAVFYAARDSDSTRRIYPMLIERSHKYDGRVMLGDIDKW